MVRITKKPDERIDEFLNAAQQLFFKKGYDKTSVDNITQKVGVAKGTFYLYFKSKEDVLDGLANRIIESSLNQTREVVDRTDLNALEKLKRYYSTSRNYKVANKNRMKVMMRALSRKENSILRNKIMQRSMELNIPEFNKIINQGVEEGVFRVKYPDQIGEFIFMLSDRVSYDIREYMLDLDKHPENLEIVITKIRAYEHVLEKILSIPEGTLKLYDKKTLEEFK